MNKINYKPLSVNECWQGRRFRSPLYKRFAKSLFVLLSKCKPKRPPEKTPLFAHYRWGVSNILSDIDNPTKPFQDVLFEFWEIKSDHKIEFMILEKKKVSKGEEFIDFEVKPKDDLIEYLEDLIAVLKEQQ